MKVIEIYIEESKVNKGCFIMVVVTESGEKFIMAGDHYSPTYLTPYEKSFDTKPLKKSN